MSLVEHDAIAVTFTPTETRHNVIVEVATEAERSSCSAFFVAEGWEHDPVVILAEIRRNIIVRQLLRPPAPALRPSPVPRTEPARPSWMPAPAVVRPAANGNGSDLHRTAVARRSLTAYDVLRGRVR